MGIDYEPHSISTTTTTAAAATTMARGDRRDLLPSAPPLDTSAGSAGGPTLNISTLTRQPSYYSAMRSPRQPYRPRKRAPGVNSAAPVEGVATKAAIADIQSVMNDDNDNLGYGLAQKPPLPKIKKKFPFFVPILSIAQIALFIVTVVFGGFEQVWINPMIGPPQETMIEFGGKIASRMRPPHWELWRLLTAFMLHSGIIHILLNMLWQLNMVLRMELFWGGLRVGPIYILSGVAGNLLSSIFLPENVSIGASSCLSGLMGALLADLILNWAVLPTPWKNLIGLSIQLFLFFLVGFIPFVDNFSHIGGFVVGFLAGLVLVPRIVPKFDQKKGKNKKKGRAKGGLTGMVRSLFGSDKAIVNEEGRSVHDSEPGDTVFASLTPEQQKQRNKLKKRRRRLNIIYAVVRLVAFVLLVLFFIVGFILLFGVVGWECRWCYYINPTWEMLFEGIE